MAITAPAPPAPVSFGVVRAYLARGVAQRIELRVEMPTSANKVCARFIAPSSVESAAATSATVQESVSALS